MPLFCREMKSSLEGLLSKSYNALDEVKVSSAVVYDVFLVLAGFAQVVPSTTTT